MAHDVGSRTEGPEPLEDLQIGVGLDRVCKQDIRAGKSRFDPPIRGFDHAGVVYIQR